MMQLSAAVTNKQVLSLRTGGVIASVMQPIINPNNLKIIGFYCQDRFDKNPLILLGQDIREVAPQGYIVNDHEVLVDQSELIRDKEIIKLNFVLLGKQVVTVGKKRLGKVNDYAVDMDSLYITKLYVVQPLLKNISGGQLAVDRDQIVEITNKKIVIQEPLQGVKATSFANATATN
jgi:uncharacterized protein YrrD